AMRLTLGESTPVVYVDTSAGRYSGSVYVSYALTDFQGDEGAAVTIFNSRLRALAGYPLHQTALLVAPTPKSTNADQFWPASAVDPSTGAVWACFYDTRGDPKRTGPFYACS